MVHKDRCNQTHRQIGRTALQRLTFAAECLFDFLAERLDFIGSQSGCHMHLGITAVQIDQSVSQLLCLDQTNGRGFLLSLLVCLGLNCYDFQFPDQVVIEIACSCNEFRQITV